MAPRPRVGGRLPVGDSAAGLSGVPRNVGQSGRVAPRQPVNAVNTNPATQNSTSPSTAGGQPAQEDLPLSALVVIHEWWGLNEWVKEQAADLAAHGYVALAVDLYRGQVADDSDTAHQLSRGVPQDRGIRDLKAANTFLRADKHVDPKRIGAVGYCFGGSMAWLGATRTHEFQAASCWYGVSFRKAHAG